MERERNAQNQTSQLTWTGAKTKQVKLPLQWRLRRRWWSLAERMEIFNRSDIVTQQARLLTIRSLGGMNTKVTHCHFLWMMGYWHCFICGGGSCMYWYDVIQFDGGARHTICICLAIRTCWKDFIHYVYFSVYSILFVYSHTCVCTCRRVDTRTHRAKTYMLCAHWMLELCALVPSLSSYQRFLSRHYRFFLLCRRRRHFRLSWSWFHFRPSIVSVSGLNVERSLSLCFGFTKFLDKYYLRRIGETTIFIYICRTRYCRLLVRATFLSAESTQSNGRWYFFLSVVRFVGMCSYSKNHYQNIKNRDSVVWCSQYSSE